MRRRAWHALPLALLAIAFTTGFSWHLGARTPKAGTAGTERSAFPAAELPHPHAGERILIVSPHPDDETLGCGGLIQQALAAGADVHIAIVTNGDASELALIFGEHELPLRRSAFQDLGRRRQQEALQAVGRLGVTRERVHFLGYPNNGLLSLWRPEHWPRNHPFRSPYTGVSVSPYRLTFTPHAPYAGQQVMADLVKLLEQVRPDAVFVTHPHDVHPDHWSTAAFTRFALGSLAGHAGKEWVRRTHVYGFVIHWPDYPAPRRLRPKASLAPPALLTKHGERWLTLPLSDEQAKRKLAAIKTYSSQLPAFDRLLLAFARKNEVFEELTPARYTAGATLSWPDEDSGNRRLGGVEVTGVRLRVRRGSAVVDVDTRAARIPSRGYIGFDLRAWDGAAGAQIITAYVDARSARAAGVSAKGDLLTRLLTALSPRRGLAQIPDLPLPTGAQLPNRFFVTCWGSLQDRPTDPAVNTPVE